jgi:hypothetical protein
MFSDHNGMKLDYNRNKCEKFTGLKKPNNVFLNNQRIEEEMTRKIRKWCGRRDYEEKAHQNLQSTVKVGFGEKSIPAKF